jgi:UbiD family decarboxylase
MANDPRSMKASDINDLRSTLEFLARIPGQLVSTAVEVDPYLELAGVYRRVGAGTPVAPPTKIGPAMLFEKVKGYDMPVVAGILASRKRTALLVGSTPERLMFDLMAGLDRPVPPVTVDSTSAPCQEVVIRPPLDLNKVIPAIVSTERDAGPFFNLGLLRAQDPETGVSDVTIHRMCVIGPDRLSVSITPGRHIGLFRSKAEAMGKALPVSVSIGVDPAVYLATSFEPPTTPVGFDELTIAGGMRGRPVELVDCVTQPVQAIARAEIVLECEFLPGDRADEDVLTGGGWAMPEFPGYLGRAQKDVAVLHVTAITHRVDPILQILIGPGEEHVTLSGLPTEASIYRLVEDAMPGFLQNVYVPPAGGGKYLAVLQIKKRTIYDEGRQRQAALTAFTAFYELKHVILVDEDVDIYDANDVMWAITTRYQGDLDTLFIPEVKCHNLDPTATPEYNSRIPIPGVGCKTIFDCTVPFALKDRFLRSPFVDVDLEKFLPPEA